MEEPRHEPQRRRRRRRRPAGGSAPLSPDTSASPGPVQQTTRAAAFDPSGRFAPVPRAQNASPPIAAAPIPTPPRPGASPPAARGRVPAENQLEAAGEQTWERTHLEQTMFQLAREHADAAGRCARATPPDRPGEQTHSLVAVLMSYFALEAFINMVGGDRLGDRFRHYDRMSPEGKWVEVTRLVSKTGQTFREDGDEMRALSTLRSWRNTLTHYKGEYEDVQQSGRGRETRIEALLSAANAARAVEIARTLFEAFYTLDKRSAPRQFVWLNDRPHQSQTQRPPRTTARPSSEPSAEGVATGADSQPPAAVDGGRGRRAQPGRRRGPRSPSHPR